MVKRDFVFAFSSLREWRNIEHLLVRIRELGYPVKVILSTHSNSEIDVIRQLVGAVGFPLYELLVSHREAKQRKLGRSNVRRFVSLIVNNFDPGIFLQAANHYHLSFFDLVRKRKWFVATTALQWGIADLVPYLCVDKYLMFGAYSKQELVSKGVSAKRLFVVGNPGWDLLKDIEIEDNGSIVYLAQTRHTPERVIIGDLQLHRLLEVFPDKHLIIKEHPARYGEFTYCATLPRVTVIQDQVSSLDLIRKASVNITTGSTCAVESMLLGKPTIVLNMSKGDVYQDSGQLCIPDWSEVKKRCDLLFRGVMYNQDKLEAFKRQVAYSYDTYNATERTIEMLLGWFHHGESISEPRS